MSGFIHVVCPNCASVNRMAPGQNARAAKCGRCGKVLFSGHPVAVNGETLAKQIERSDAPVVVDFWADWCAPCRVMAPIFERAAAEMEPKFRFVKLDTEAEPAVAARYNIQSIPTMMVFRHGRVLGQRVGVVPQVELHNWLTRVVAEGG